MVTVLAVFTVLQLYCPTIWLLYLCGFLGSLGGGVFDSSNTVWVIEMWADRSPPVANLSAMLYGLGTILSPMLVKPFLTGDPDSDETTTVSTVTTITTTPLVDTNDANDRRARLQTPFLIAGAITLIG